MIKDIKRGLYKVGKTKAKTYTKFETDYPRTLKFILKLLSYPTIIDNGHLYGDK